MWRIFSSIKLFLFRPDHLGNILPPTYNGWDTNCTYHVLYEENRGTGWKDVIRLLLGRVVVPFLIAEIVKTTPRDKYMDNIPFFVLLCLVLLIQWFFNLWWLDLTWLIAEIIYYWYFCVRLKITLGSLA